MGQGRQIGTLPQLSKYAFASACAALPWIDLLPVSTYLLIGAGGLLFASKAFHEKGFRSLLNPLTILFLSFYLLQILGYAMYHSDPHNRFSLEQKSSLLFIPLFLTGYIELVPDGWTSCIRSFIAGTVAACVLCLILAFTKYAQSGGAYRFFYHTYASGVQANAIHLSLYVLVSICVLVFYTRRKQVDIGTVPLVVLVSFLYLNLILLSSRLIIITGSVLLVYMLSSLFRKSSFRLIAAGLIGCILLLILVTENPVRQRYNELDLQHYRETLKRKDFTNYPFNGLDIRLLLWDLGREVLDENNSWLAGLGGRTYHRTLNEKMLSYHLFPGNEVTKDTGYLNYDMHNQYMENLIQFGIIGLCILVAILAFTAYDAVRTHHQLLLLLVLVFSVSFVSESLLETQSGILLFTIFIYAEWKQSKLPTPFAGRSQRSSLNDYM